MYCIICMLLEVFRYFLKKVICMENEIDEIFNKIRKTKKNMESETKNSNYGNQHTYQDIAEIENAERKILKNYKCKEKSFHDLLAHLQNVAIKNYSEYVEWLESTDKYMEHGVFPPENEYQTRLQKTKDLLHKLKTFRFNKNNKKAIDEYYKIIQKQPPKLDNNFQNEYNKIIKVIPKIYETYPPYWSKKYRNKIKGFDEKNLVPIDEWITKLNNFLDDLNRAETQKQIDKLNEAKLSQVYQKTLVPGDCWQRLLTILGGISQALTGFLD